MIDKVQDDCTGCGACYSICPVDAISMVSDAEGFLQPSIDTSICTQCGLCAKKCPALGELEILNSRDPQVFAAWCKDEGQRINSSSGGVFSELAKQVLNKGGHVVGARYNSDYTVEHVCISNTEELHLLRQSKYLQSEIGHIFRDIKRLLKTNAPVLFCGTPCQAAGLLSYLGKVYKNLTVCDFVCHGVPSPMVYKMYLADLEIEYQAPVESIQFRNKNSGWKKFCTFIVFENGKTYQRDLYQDTYMYGFLKNLYLRPCCYKCKFKKIPRVADITLGDFWGIGDTRPHIDQDKGTSLVFINTSKGREDFAAASKGLISEECTLDEAINGNPCILTSVAKPKKRQQFFQRLRRAKSFFEVIRKYQNPGKVSSRIKKKIGPNSKPTPILKIKVEQQHEYWNNNISVE